MKVLFGFLKLIRRLLGIVSPSYIWYKATAEEREKFFSERTEENEDK
jgi:hypothetical protein